MIAPFIALGNSDTQPTGRWSDGHMGFWAGRSGRRYLLVLWSQSGGSFQRKEEHTEASNGPIWEAINKYVFLYKMNTKITQIVLVYKMYF